MRGEERFSRAEELPGHQPGICSEERSTGQFSWQEAIIMGWVILVLALLCAWLASIVIDQKQSIKEKNKFLDDYEGLKCNFLDQKRIDYVLAVLAEGLDKACRQEVNLQKISSPLIESDSVSNSELVLHNTQSEIKARKREFWEARRLAKEFVFQVKSSYRSYLPKPTPSEPPSGHESEELPIGKIGC